jgi:alpha-1,3-glucosyltransferase
MNQPPKFGDYEAQRHWMELTLHTPLREWYVQTPRNDLLYWGLDYPPLTAYHSRLCAQLLHLYAPESVALLDSRGHESFRSKLLMRLTVLITDAFILFPAAVVSSRLLWAKTGSRAVFASTASLLLHPALIIIDHGHFQYNGVMVAFAVLSVALLYKAHVGRAAAAAAAAVLFKQMALLLGPYWLVAGLSLIHRTWRSQGRVAALGCVLRAAAGAGAVLAAALLPFYFTATLNDVFSRVFPVTRGLYEDKVATVWCALSPLLKLQVRPPTSIR